MTITVTNSSKVNSLCPALLESLTNGSFTIFKWNSAFYLKENPVGILVPGTGAIFSDYDAVFPDLIFVRNDRWAEVTSGQKITSAPDIVVEILSPGSENRRRDLSVKRQLYAKYGVKEYWIVDSENLSVLIFHLLERALEEFATLSGTDELTSPLLPGFQVKVGAVFDLS